MVKLSEKELNEIEQKVKEGFVYAAKNEVLGDMTLLFKEKPEHGKFINDSFGAFYSKNSMPEGAISRTYDKFVTYESSPVYLPDVVQKQKEMRCGTVKPVEFLKSLLKEVRKMENNAEFLKQMERMCKSNTECSECDAYKSCVYKQGLLCDFERFVEIVENWSKNHPEIILTEQQKTAIRGRIAEGAKWIARDGSDVACFYSEKPRKNNDYRIHINRLGYEMVDSSFDIYDFVKWENSPINLQSLLDNQPE